MNRLLATGAALSVILGTTGLAFAQGVNPAPYYSGPGNAPYYGQSMPSQQAAAPQPYAEQTPPVTEPHSTGGAGRAYYNGQKTN